MPLSPVSGTAPDSSPPWLEALPDSAAVIDERGTIVAVNAPWRAFARANDGAPHGYLGENYLAVCRNAPAADVGNLPQALAEVIEGTSDRLEREYSCHAPSERRWFRLIATRFQDHDRCFVLMLHRDVTLQHMHELESVLAHTREGLVVIQGTNTIRYANARAGELLGDLPEHLFGQDLGIPIPSMQGQTLELPISAEYPRTVEMFAVEAEWEGEPVRVLHLHDITDRVTAERALKENEDLFERTNQVSRVGGWEADLFTGDQKWTAVTHEILEVDPVEPTPPLDEALLCFYKGKSSQVVLSNLQYMIDHGEPVNFETQLLTRTGRIKWVRIQGEPEIRDGVVTRLFGTLQDITERKELETRLVEWGAAVEATSEGVMITDAEERITAVNPAFTAITGYSEEEVKGCTPRVLQSGLADLDAYEPVWTKLNKQHYWQGETRERGKDGEVFPIWQTINAVTDQTGKITHYVFILTDLSRIKQAEQQLEYLAYYDPLTGLPNRRLFEDRLEQALVEARRSGETLAVLLLDLNDFKALNDGFGHEMGDEVLMAIGPRIQGVLNEGDTVARWGGDELVLLARNREDHAVISELAERVLNTLETPFPIANQEFRLSASIGIALGDASAQSASSLIMQADGAMYRAKRTRQRFAFFSSEVGEAARERMHLGTALARALEHGHLAVHYQPQVELRSGDCLGLEALARWPHAREGWISPARFIPVAEQSRLILRLGAWVLEQACRQASQSLAAGWDFGRLAVNVASPQLRSNGFVDLVDRVLKQTGLSPARLELEVTESSLIESGSSVFKTLEALQHRGIHIAIDDFGTGYSSLRYLKDLPVDRLKIDRSFVEGITEDGKARALVQTVIALGSSLGFEVLAEGIETPAQLEGLMQEGCLAGQGYLFAKPLDPVTIAELRFPLHSGQVNPDLPRGDPAAI